MEWIQTPEAPEFLARSWLLHAATTRYLSQLDSALSEPDVSRSSSSCRSGGGYSPHWATADCEHLDEDEDSASATPLCVLNHSMASEVVIGSEYKPTDAIFWQSPISPLIRFSYYVAHTPDVETIGGRVAWLREARGLNQTQLAKKIGVAQSAISMIEDGTTKSLSGKVLAGLCEHLCTTPRYILSGGGAAPSKEVAVGLAELSKLAQDMTPDALKTVLHTARAVLAVDRPVEHQSIKQIGSSHAGKERPEPREQGRVGRNVRRATERIRADDKRRGSKPPKKAA